MLSSEISGHHLPEDAGPSLEVHPSEVRSPKEPRIGGRHEHGDFQSIHKVRHDSEREKKKNKCFGDASRTMGNIATPIQNEFRSLQTHEPTSSEPSQEVAQVSLEKFRTQPGATQSNGLSSAEMEGSSNRSRSDQCPTSEISHKPMVQSHFSYPTRNPHHASSTSSDTQYTANLPITTPIQEEFSTASSQMLNHADSAAMPSPTQLQPPSHTHQGDKFQGDEGTAPHYHDRQVTRQMMPLLTTEKQHILEPPVGARPLVARVGHLTGTHPPSGPTPEQRRLSAMGTVNGTAFDANTAFQRASVHHNLGQDSRAACNSAESPGLKRKNPDAGATPNTQSTNNPTEQRHCQLDLPFRLRNKKMRPTDCLLFAATLLENDDTQSTPSISAHVEMPVTIHAAPVDTAGVHTTTSSAAGLATEVGDSLTKPRDVDVLCGRGGLINKHPGNIVYRKVVDFNKPFYQSVHKKHRILVSQSIVRSILNFGGRFLILGSKGKPWVEIGFKRAVQKTSQALRERNCAQDDDQNTKDDEDQEGESDGQYDESNSDDVGDDSDDEQQCSTQSSHKFDDSKCRAL
jgi:hypothetical protein